MAAFTWIADVPADAQRAPRASVVTFGDGYEQRQGDGINTLKQVWQLTFSQRHFEEADAIDNFLIARDARENFDWTPPRSSTQGRYVCRTWNRQISKGPYDTITATFEQVFDNA